MLFQDKLKELRKEKNISHFGVDFGNNIDGRLCFIPN